MKRNPYPAHKPSGVDWLGDVPEHWEVKKVGHTTFVKGRIGWQGLTSDEFIDEGPFCITGTDFIDGKIDWNTCYHVSEERYLEDPYIHLRENDLLITKDGTIGKTAVVSSLQGKATLNSGIFLTRPIRVSYSPEFMFWTLNSRVFSDFIELEKTGTTISHLYQNVFVRFHFPLPPLPEQQVIAIFLDAETGKIDSLVTKNQRLVELLKEKRMALISRAVTKGLDPTVPMKPSGVEWLGDVPEHWEIWKLSHLANKIGSGKTPSGGADVYQTEGVLFIRSQNVYDDGLWLDDVVYVDIAIDEDMAWSRVKPNDILLNITGASLGRTCITPVDIPAANVNQHVCIIRMQNIDYAGFIALFLKSKIAKGFYEFVQTGSAREGLNFQQISAFLVPLPPLIEQQAIATFLDTETAKIDALINKVETVIEKLKEYRTALISAAVTGKIDVREAV